LNICGLYLGDADDLMSGAIGNKKGFWEHLWRLCAKLLR